MADPMKIRATLKGEGADIRVLMSHPMENGMRKDGEGNLIPAHYIQNIHIALNGKPLIRAETNTSVSKNPVFAFKLKSAKAGDKVTVTWTDNKGDKREDEVTLAA